MRGRILLAVILIYSTWASGQIRFFHFIDSVYQVKEIDKSRLIKTELLNSGYKLSPDEPMDAALEKLLYMHMLITGNYALNGDNYGVFQIPYFRNFCAENPRDSILYIRKGKKLKEIACAACGGSMATQERVPPIFWGDFVTDDPKYSWSDLGTFYTFGWCSEREMAFKAWLNLSGFSSVIAFRDGHVWMEIDLPSRPGYFLFMDNTFNRFEIRPLSQKSKIDPKDKYLTWYNNNGSDKAILQKLSTLSISPERASELERRIVNFFNGHTEDY